MSSALDTPTGVFKRDDGRWVRHCPLCESVVDHLRRNYCVNAHLQKQPCKKCSNQYNGHERLQMCGPVRMSWYESFRKSAVLRGKVWDLTPQDVADAYESQGGVCALTGWKIGWDEEGWSLRTSASVDRIDSSLDYTKENIQIVHKHVNMMKQQYDNDYFIEVCKAVATKW